MTAPESFTVEDAPKSRVAWLDLARGAALVAMGVYHLVWDLGFFDLIPADTPEDARFKAFGHAIAASFLLIVGVSLALATRQGLAGRSYLKRTGLVALAAVAVTVATYAMQPDALIFFGILHCIVVSSLLSLAVVRAPLLIVLACAAAALVAPLVVAWPTLDSPWLIWIGLGTREPTSLDWRPLFPWLGVVLAGVGLGRAGLAHGLFDRRRPAPAQRARVAKWLGFAGRHSLAVYLVHQPVLLAMLFGVASVMGTHPLADEAPFLRACETQCRDHATRDYCTRVCGCVATRTKPLPMWRDVLANRLTPDQSRAFDAIAAQCVRETRPPPR